MDPRHSLFNPTPTESAQFGRSVAISGNLVVVGEPLHDSGAADSGAAHIYDATTGALLRTLLNPTPALSDQFGWSVATSGDFVVVGAPFDDTGAADSGAAYIYDATTGALLRTLLNPTPSTTAQFGFSIAISGNLAVVGTLGNDSGAAGSGAAHIYDATTGALLRTLLSPTPAFSDRFGFSAAISGNLVVVGAPFDAAGGTNSGAAHVFDVTTGALLRTLNNPMPQPWDEFGRSVAISGNLAVVGTFGDDTGAADSGAAHIYDATTGALLRTLLNPTPAFSDRFGISVAISGNLVVVGAPFDDTGAQDAGAAYIYDATTGALLRTINNPMPARWDEFGSSVAVSGNLVVIGTPLDGAGAPESGAAYIYQVLVGQTATGFPASAVFGSPIHHATYPVLGTTTTVFGVPGGANVAGDRVLNAVGHNSAAAFGAVAAIATATAQAEGWSPLTLGTLRVRQTFSVGGWETAPTFGSARVASDHFADGFSSTVVIPPSALPTAPPPTQNWVLSAQGGSTTTFGSATAPAAVAVQVSGWSATRLGAPAGHQAATTIGWQPLNFGTANGVVRATALGFRTTQFGSGRSNVGRLTSAALPATHFGSRAIARHGRNLLTQHAEGFVVPPHIGNASASPVYRARHHPPSVRYGRAVVRRADVC